MLNGLGFDEFLLRAQDSLFKYHVWALHEVASYQGDVQQSELITVLHGRLLARNRFAETLSSILITIGLIGTVVGFILMMNALVAMIGKNGSANLVVELFKPGSGPLEGLSFAFMKTLIAATIGGVFFRILNAIVEKSIDEYVDQVTEQSVIHVIPALKSSAQVIA